MANHQPLNNVTHKDLRVVTSHHPKFGDSESYARVVLSELAFAQTDYPLFLRKHGETGQFEIVSLLGLGQEENLFVDEKGWDAHYVPLSIQRRPFLIGFQQDTSDPNLQPMVHIDMDSPRISKNKEEGEAVFLPQGGQSPYLQHINSVLNVLHNELPQTEAFVNLLQELSLVEPVDIKVELNNSEKVELAGLYTIHEENLASLSAEELARLHEKNYLKAVYMIVASVNNLTRLIARKNALG